MTSIEMKLQAALDRIAELERLAGLTLLTPPKPDELHFTPTEAKIAGLLLMRGVDKIVTREMIHIYIYGVRPECDQPTMCSIDRQLHNLRRIVKPHNVKISNRYGDGWYLTRENAERLAAVTSFMMLVSRRGAPRLRAITA
jgi:DNA-binding response OmpR family regulator